MKFFLDQIVSPVTQLIASSIRFFPATPHLILPAICLLLTKTALDHVH